MIVRTNKLPLFKRLLAKLIHKIQILTIKSKYTISIYYALAPIHFSLHYSVNNLKKLAYLQIAHADKMASGEKQLLKLAVRRHIRIIEAAGVLNKDQIKIFKKQIAKAFVDGVLGK